MQQRADHVRRRLQELYSETPFPLDHKDPFTLLVAVLLSARCTDVRVNLVTPALFAHADNPRDMMCVPVGKVQAIVRPCCLSPRIHFRIGLENAVHFLLACFSNSVRVVRFSTLPSHEKER